MTTTRTEKQKMDIASIAKAVRTAIKEAVKGGQLPAFETSVRISRYAGGQSLRVEVTGVPAGYLIPNLENAKWLASAESNAQWNAPYGCREALSPTAEAHLQLIKSFVDEYHYDQSDISADYFNCNFYRTVQFGDCAGKQRDELVASLRAPVACKVLKATKAA
jgi:hypothetical protein